VSRRDLALLGRRAARAGRSAVVGARRAVGYFRPRRRFPVDRVPIPENNGGVTDPRDRFSNLSDLYHKYRPTYPAEVIDYVLSLAPTGRIADLGCGTGISTRLLAARGRDVVGIDPNDAMLDVARREGGTYLKGEAAAT